LETGYLRLRDIKVMRITIIKFGVNDGGGNDTGSGEIQVRADIAKLMVIDNSQSLFHLMMLLNDF